jgi:hypothetical protein
MTARKAARPKPPPALGPLLAQLPHILGDDERRVAAALGRVIGRSGRPGGRVPAVAAAPRPAPPAGYPSKGRVGYPAPGRPG